jgi:hypothetical protein
MMDGYRRLLAATLLRAAKDAQDADPSIAVPARRWLQSEGPAWVEWLDLPPERVDRWLNDLPALPWEQLPLFD